MTPKHSPLPYHLKRVGMELYMESTSAMICDFQRGLALSDDQIKESEDNAAFLLRVCNAHYELVEALSALNMAYNQGRMPTLDERKACCAALAKARGGA